MREKREKKRKGEGKKETIPFNSFSSTGKKEKT